MAVRVSARRRRGWKADDIKAVEAWGASVLEAGATKAMVAAKVWKSQKL